MELAGNFFLIFTFALTIISLWMLIVHRPLPDSFAYRLLHRFQWLAFAGIFLSAGSLVYLLLAGSMHIEYVARYTSHGLPLIFRFSALWAGQSGSLLVWTFIHITFTLVVWIRYRNRYPEWLRPSGIVLLTIQLFFLAMNIWVLNPFRILVTETPGGLISFTPADGQGLNPLLHHPAMILHPPLLFIGYAGSSVVFAIAAAALWLRQNELWFTLMRRWLLFTWLFLTAGIGLGAWWAYAELGWGGYWAWDPVENASLMPWLIATALMHTLILRNRGGLFSLTSLILAAGYYFFCVLGTFITRSGMINSVHAFSQSSVGLYFLVLLAAIFIFTLCLAFRGRRYFRAGKSISSFISAESMTVLLTITLVIFTLAVLAGTLFPAIAAQLFGKTILLDSLYYNRLTRFLIVVLLLILTGGLIIHVRKNQRLNAPLVFLLCGIFFITGTVLSYFITRSLFFSFLSGIILTAFVLTAMKWYNDFFRSGNAPPPGKKSFIPKLFSSGTALAHIGLLLVCFGVSGSLMDQSVVIEGHKTQSFDYYDLRFTIEDFTFEQNRLFESLTGKIILSENEQTIFTFAPEYRYYYASRQTSTEVSVYSAFLRDIYVVLTHYDADRQSARFQIYFNPLVSWIWAGCLLIVAGAALAFYKRSSSHDGLNHE